MIKHSPAKNTLKKSFKLLNMGKNSTKALITVFFMRATHQKKELYLCTLLQGTVISSLSVLCSGTRSVWLQKTDS